MSTSTSTKLRSAGVLISLVGVIAGLHFLARFGLSGPARMTPDALRAWMGEPVAVVATMARWISLLLTYYLAAVVGAAVILGDQLESTRFGRFTPQSVSGLVGVLLGTTAIVVPMATNEAPIEAPATQLTPEVPLVLEQLEPLTLDSEEGSTDLGLVWDVNSKASDDDAWTVERGDSFWSIAEETLQDHGRGGNLSEEDIADYWRVLIAANEDRLVEPGNPDLILPGQELILPPSS